MRILVVEDQQLLLDTLVNALSQVEGFEVVATASSVRSFGQVLSQLPGEPDVVVTDIDLGDGSGQDVAERTRRETAAEVLFITGHSEGDGVRLALEAGATGFISKTAPLAEFVAAVRSVAEGIAVFPSSLLQQSFRDDETPEPAGSLTTREREVLARLAEGGSLTDISTALDISAHTTRNHIRSILSKLDARSQLEAVVKGVRYRIVEIR